MYVVYGYITFQCYFHFRGHLAVIVKIQIVNSFQAFSLFLGRRPLRQGS